MHHQDDQLLAMIAALPVLSPTDRLYVSAEGHLVCDSVHGYLGGFGRLVLDRVFGGYSRNDVINRLAVVSLELGRLAIRCVTNLTNPSSLKAFKVRTLETTHYEKCVSDIAHRTVSLQTFLGTLLIAYSTDQTACGQFRSFIRSSEQTYSLIAPFLTGRVM
jgi:hypothetical protein